MFKRGAFYFLFFSFSLVFPNITEIVNKSAVVTTNYVNAMQNQSIYVEEALGNEITINIADKIKVHFTRAPATFDVKAGSSELDTYSAVIAPGFYQFNYRVKWLNTFSQDEVLPVTINSNVGDVTTNVLTYNHAFVIQSFNLTSNALYRFSDSSGDWFKGGIGVNQGLQSSGIISYKYNLDVYPYTEVNAKVFFDGVAEGAVTGVGTDGSFSFTNFTLPVSSTGVSPSVEFKIDILVNLSDAFLDTGIYSNTKNIQLDNEAPDIGATELVLVPDSSDNGSDGVLPDVGWYDQLTVSVRVSPDMTGVTDNTGAGVRSTFLFETTAEGVYADPSSIATITAVEGTQRQITVYFLDNVYNYVTRSALVSIDVTVPGVFYVSLENDSDFGAGQQLPAAGWYNDTTVSFNWTLPNDASLRATPYQIRSDIGWPTWSAQVGSSVVLDQFQSVREAGELIVAEGGSNARTIYVRAIDKAGNVREGSTSVYVDTTPPSVNSLSLVADTSATEGNKLPEIGWYNNGSEVRWSWSVSDGGELPNQPYRYHNSVGTRNITTSDWTNVTDIILSTSEAPTGNDFVLQVADKAGNLTIATGTVYVDETPPVFSMLDIIFVTDNTDADLDGVFPQPGWYDQPTLDIILTWNIFAEAGQLSKLYLKTKEDASYSIQSVTNPTFNDYTVIPQDSTKIVFTALFADKAGWVQSLNDGIYSDVNSPANLHISVAQDDDDDGDGIIPETGWDDDGTIAISWQQPIGSLRSSPYRVKINNNSWSSWMSVIELTSLTVSIDQRNEITIQCADEAGNIVTNSVVVTVDTQVPSGNFDLLLVDDTTYYDTAVPDPGWYNDNYVRVQFATENVSDNFGLRDARYFVKNLSLKQDYGTGYSISNNVTINTAEGGGVQQYIYGAIADKAGNVLQDQVSVRVDMTNPDAIVGSVKADSTDSDSNGFLPESGWYDDLGLEVEWSTVSDPGGQIHQTGPYRLRAETTSNWTAWQAVLFYNDLPIQEGGNTTLDVYVQSRDKAGNVTTKSLAIKVDVTAPQIITFNIVSQDPIIDSDIPSGISLPLATWYNQEIVTLSWDVVSDNGELRAEPYRYSSSSPFASYSSFTSNTTAILGVSANGHSTVDVYLFAIDKAGNGIVATRSIKVDTVAPVVTINMDISRNFIKPYVLSSDILLLTLDLSEDLVVTPMLSYALEGTTNVTFSVELMKSGIDWIASVDISVLDDGRYSFGCIAFDNAGNKTTSPNGDILFIVSNQSPPQATSFNAFDPIYLDENYTKQNIIRVTFDVDSQIDKFFLTEVEGRLYAESNYGSFLSYPRADYNYSFSDSVNEPKVLHLWVANNKGVICTQSVTCDIYYDDTAPYVRIQPNKNTVSSPNEKYDNITVAKGIFTARLEITNLKANEDPAYVESSIVTPFWQVLLPTTTGYVTKNLNPVLEDSAKVPGSVGYRAYWAATYNTNEAQISGNGLFRMMVTDNARNATNIIQAGGTFNVNLDAATNPKLLVYSLDGRTDYTNSLTVSVVISKDAPSSVYDYYKIVDGSYNKPLLAEVSTPWPGGDKITVNYRLDAGVSRENATQGRKSIYVWTKNSNYLNPGIVEEAITFDIVIPTFSFFTTLFTDINNTSLDEDLRSTVSISEQLDPSTPTLHLIAEDKVTTLDSSRLVYSGRSGTDWLYVTTINVPGSYKSKDTQLRIVAEDLAGNELDAQRALRQQLRLEEYIDETNPSSLIVEQGGDDYLFMSVVVSANDQPIHLAGIRILVEGQYIPADIDRFSVYTDGDNNGLLEPKKKYDTWLGEDQGNLSETGGSLYIPFDTIQVITSTNPVRYFIAGDIYNGAVEGHSLVLKFATRNAFEVDEYEVVNYSAAHLNFNTRTVGIVQPVSDIIVNSLDDVGITPTLNQGGTNFLLKRVRLYTNVGTVLWSGLNLRFQGSMDPTKITRIALYKDSDENGSFDEGTDLLITDGSDKFEIGASITTINLKTNQVLVYGDHSEQRIGTYYIVADLDLNTPIGVTFSVNISSANEVFVETPNQVLQSSLPVQSMDFYVDRYVSKVDVDFRNNPAEDVFQGDRIVLQKLNLTVDKYSPTFRYIDYVLSGTAGRNDFSEIALYTLTPNIPYSNSYFYDTGDSAKIASTYTWSESNTRLRIEFDNPIFLASSNSFALVATINPSSQIDKTFLLTNYFNEPTGNPYIYFDNGTVLQNKLVTTNSLLIIDAYKPSQPLISANYYSPYVQQVSLAYDSYTKAGNNITKTRYSIGTVREGTDVLTYTESAVPVPRAAILEENFTVPGISLDDNSTYYLTLQTISERDDTPGVEYYSKSAIYTFHTDFSPPHLPTNYSAELYVGDSGVDNISHQLSWGSFIEEESGIDSFIVEEQSNYSPTWTVIETIKIADPSNIKSTDRQVYLEGRLPNMSYTYRIKAKNLAGLESEYIYSNTESTAYTNQVLTQVSNYPNPFYSRSETTKIFYYLNQDTGIEIKIYDAIGHYVTKFNYPSGISGKSTKGDCTIEWDGRNESGEFVEKGGYFIVIEAPEADGENTKVVRMVGVIH